MKKIKKVPQRKCIACQDRDNKKELIRIVKNKEGEIFIDLTGKANGRGAYICKDCECLKKAIKSTTGIHISLNSRTAPRAHINISAAAAAAA